MESVPAVPRSLPKPQSQKEVRHLGHIVSPEGITTDPKKPKAVQEWLTPKKKHDIRSCAHVTDVLFSVLPTLRNH
jgi:hypothetical protein